MERIEAFRALRLEPTADGQMVEHAYWNLARQAQDRVNTDAEARAEIERLNDAYNVLVPHAAGSKPHAAPAAAQGSGLEFLDAIVDWLSAQALRTRQRWSNRNPEIAMIGGGALVLTLLAIGSGASLMAIFLAVCVICAAIWAPWRREG
jgi:hypothetical protein